MATLIGAIPGGLVVFAVGSGLYIATDMTIRLLREREARRHVTIEDLRAYGIEPDTIFALSEASLFSLPSDSTLDLPTDSTLDLPVDSTQAV